MSKTRSNRSATKHWRLQAIGLVHLESRVVNDVVDNTSGSPRTVSMPRCGFFYLISRDTGALMYGPVKGSVPVFRLGSCSNIRSAVAEVFQPSTTALMMPFFQSEGIVSDV